MKMIWVDNARILAVFAVVVLHVAAVVVLGIEDLDNLNWWVANIIDSSVRWCVPTFVMISGLLLLDPNKEMPFINQLRQVTKEKGQ